MWPAHSTLAEAVEKPLGHYGDLKRRIYGGFRPNAREAMMDDCRIVAV
jgi:hypothetical protein